MYFNYSHNVEFRIVGQGHILKKILKKYRTERWLWPQ